MSRSRPTTLLATALAVPLAAVVVAGCGGGNDNSGNSNSATVAPAKTVSSNASTVGLAKNDKLGKVLVDANGNTLYLFEKDTKGKSMCSGACATDWPPLTASGKPTAGDGADQAAIGTTMRSDGKSQVTYNGHPVYRYAGDTQPGEANGQGLNAFGAEWYAVGKSGNAVENGDEDSGSSGGGNGY
jgi:predicted lipoprotein with Yx(FWY)xxD motif